MQCNDVAAFAATLEFRGGKLSVQQFLKLALGENRTTEHCFSLAKAIWGDKRTRLRRIHLHNVCVQHDKWYGKALVLVRTWTAWGCPADLQWQLIMMAVVFSHHNVLDALLKCDSINALPMDSAARIVENESKLRSFLLRLLRRKKPIFSDRYMMRQHNSCKELESAMHLMEDKLELVLCREEMDSLVTLQTYPAKLKFLGRKKGFSRDVGDNFAGKNVLNVLHHLGRECETFEPHCIKDMENQPVGPGSMKYYELSDAFGEDVLTFQRDIGTGGSRPAAGGGVLQGRGARLDMQGRLRRGNHPVQRLRLDAGF